MVLFSTFKGSFEFFEGHTLPSVKHNPKCNASFTNAELDSSSAHHECAYITSMQPIDEATPGIEILQTLIFRLAGMRRVERFPIMILIGCYAKWT